MSGPEQRPGGETDYERCALEAEEFARRVDDPVDRAAFLKIAATWRELGEAVKAREVRRKDEPASS